VRTDGRTVEDVAGHVADWIGRTEGRAG
jgi:hypothetical protein